MNKGSAAWFDSATRGDVASLRRLAAERSEGVAVRWTDRNGSTALHWAAGSGHLEACRMLVEVSRATSLPRHLMHITDTSPCS